MQQEEKTIKELFQQLKREDERQAPPFAYTKAAALAQREPGTQRWGVQLAAVAALVLLVCSVMWWSLHGHVKKPPFPVETVLNVPKPGAPRVSTPPSLAVSVSPKPAVYRRRARRQAQPDLALLSQWRSPTEFLLRLPGDSLLKTVPRFGESRIEIKNLVPEQQNELEEQ